MRRKAERETAIGRERDGEEDKERERSVEDDSKEARTEGAC